MKQLLLTISALLFATAVCAEGYQVNTLSAKQLGMGHVGTGMKLNSESIYFNPAGTAFQTSRFSFSVGITGIKSNATYLSNNDYRGNPQIQAHSDNKISTPLYAYFNYKATKNLAVGLGFYTPYGSSMNWGDNWSGAHLVQEINLKMPNLLSRSPLVDTVDLVAEKYGFESISDLLDYLLDYKPRGPVEERYYEQFLAEALEGGAAAAASQEEPVPPMIEVDEVPF